MHIIQSSEYFYIISQHILISTLYPSAYKSGTADNFYSLVFHLIRSKKLAKFVELHICYRKYYDRPTLHYGDKTVKIMVAFADMIFVLSGLSECFVQRSDGSNTFVSKFIVFSVSYGRICPSPKITYFVVVSGSNPIGPLACNFCVLIPISAPNPNSNPSVNLVDALT